MKIQLSVKNQSIETSGITKDYKEAICEYIWNGFEANANEVRVNFSLNELGNINSISIEDNGSGVDYNEISDTFGAFLASKKNSLSLQIKSKQNKGKGRFSFIACASDAIWVTTYYDKVSESNKRYSISLSDESKEIVECSDPVNTDNNTGTVVTLNNVFGINSDDITMKNFESFLLPEFAWYLYLNKDKKIYLNNELLNYAAYINVDLSEEKEFNGIHGYDFTVDLIVWDSKIAEKFCCYYMNEESVFKHKDTTTYNRNTVDFNHSVFVKSKFFNDWNPIVDTEVEEQEVLGTTDNGKQTIKELRENIKEFISEKIDFYLSQKADDEVDKMISTRKTFPPFSEDIYDQYRKRDLSNVTKALYKAEPKIFYKLKDVQEKSLLAFMNLLLSTDERERILEIIEQIVSLTPAQREQFANILHKTRLENIIETISFIENRYKVIEVLKQLIYDLTLFTNERDHIQKIIEQNYWLFGEKYNLVTADKTMTKALEEYSNILYGSSKLDTPLPPDQEANRRMDIFLCGARKAEDSFETTIEENIVVELKAPKVPLTKTVLRQIEDYMDYVRRNSPYNGVYRRWKFIAVCKEVDDDVKAKYATFKEKGKPGLVNITENYEIYALTWDDIFKSFDISHSFCLDKLKMDRDEILSEIQNNTDASGRDKANELTKNITN